MYTSTHTQTKSNMPLIFGMGRVKRGRFCYLLHVRQHACTAIRKAIHVRAFNKECITKIFFFLISQPKHYVVGTQKNCLNERVLLSIQNICYNWRIRKYLQFYAKIFISMQIWFQSTHLFMSYLAHKKVSFQRQCHRDPHQKQCHPPFQWGDLIFFLSWPLYQDTAPGDAMLV